MSTVEIKHLTKTVDEIKGNLNGLSDRFTKSQLDLSDKWSESQISANKVQMETNEVIQGLAREISESNTISRVEIADVKSTQKEIIATQKEIISGQGVIKERVSKTEGWQKRQDNLQKGVLKAFIPILSPLLISIAIGLIVFGSKYYGPNNLTLPTPKVSKP